MGDFQSYPVDASLSGTETVLLSEGGTGTKRTTAGGIAALNDAAIAAKADDSAVVHDTGDETVAGVKTFSSAPLIPDEAYGAGWDGVLEPPTKNAVYDKVEGLSAVYQPLDSDLTAIAAANNGAVLAATTASFLTADETKLDGIEALADVTDATNVDAAGAVMNADTSTAAMAFVVDEDNMASNSATKVPTQQSVKAYVDSSGGGGTVDSVVAGTGIDVDATDPANPIVAIEAGVYRAGGTDVAVADGGTGASTASGARTNLGLVIGTDVQAHSAVLDATTASFLTADESKLDGIEALADVTDATNVDAAGAVMEADTSTASMGFVVDEDDMSSNSATKVPTQQSVKAYVDAQAGPGGGPTTVWKSTIQTIQSQTTQQDVTDLVFAIGAGEVWAGEFVLFTSGTSGGDYDFAMTAPTGFDILRYNAFGPRPGGTSDLVVTVGPTSITSGGEIPLGGINAGNGAMHIVKWFIDNGANAGSLQLQFAQTASTAVDTSILAGSYGIAHQIA